MSGCEFEGLHSVCVCVCVWPYVYISLHASALYNYTQMPSNSCQKCSLCLNILYRHKGFTLCANVTVVMLTVYLLLIRGTAGTSEELRQGFETVFIKLEAKQMKC